MIMRSVLMLGLGLAVLSAPVAADPYYKDPDIVWPTYTLVSKSYDSTLSCPQLQAEIDKVDADIRLLRHAQDKVEDAMRRSFDTQNSAGREVDGTLLNTAVSKAGSIYTEGREQIRESRRVAELRRSHLGELTASCRKAS